MIRLRDSVDLASAAVLATYLESIGRRGAVTGVAAAAERVGEVRRGRGARGVVFFYSLVDVVAMLCMLKRSGGGLGGEVTAVCGDTWIGRALRIVLAQMGMRTLAFRFGSQGLLFNDMKSLLGMDGAVAISADGLGATGHVGEGLAKLVRARRAVAIPVSVRADHASELDALRGISVPLFGAHLGVAVGEPVPDVGDLGAFAASLGLALGATRSVALDLVLDQRPHCRGR